MSQVNRIYLPNLNSLRGIAALMVIFSHLPADKFILAFKNFGTIGVTIFFTLSGFLISYLLQVEAKEFFTINVKNFYIRRILKIWPLYFLILFFVYILYPHIFPSWYDTEQERFSAKSLLMNIFFLTNVTLILKLTPFIIRVIWSIGIEEQFYLILPWIMKVEEKRRIFILFALIFLLPFSKLFLVLYQKITASDSLQIISSIITVTRFDCMAIGVLFGILSFSKEIKLGRFIIKQQYFTKKEVQITIYALALIFVLITIIVPSLFNIINYVVLPWLFAIIISNLATNKESIFHLENKVFNYLGKISYGMYLLHEFVILMLLPLVLPYLVDLPSYIKSFIGYLIAFGLTIIISHISFYCFEIQFLKLKNKVSYFKTSNEY